MNAFEAYSRESDSEATGNNDVRFSFYRRYKHSITQVGVFLQVGRFIFGLLPENNERRRKNKIINNIVSLKTVMYFSKSFYKNFIVSIKLIRDKSVL